MCYSSPCSSLPCSEAALQLRPKPSRSSNSASAVSCAAAYYRHLRAQTDRIGRHRQAWTGKDYGKHIQRLGSVLETALTHDRESLCMLALILNTLAPLHAQDVRIFDDAPAARWIAPPGIPGDSFTVFHVRKT